jgi:hypothetical protein
MMRRRDFLAAGAAAAAGAKPGRLSAQAAGAIRLANPAWSVEIDPQRLAITVVPSGQPAIAVSRGISGHRVEALRHHPLSLSWSWDSRFDLRCRLAGPDFFLRISARRPGNLQLIDQPASAIGTGLLFPKSEGYHVRPDDPAWLSFLGEKGQSFDATEDLTLPLWGMDHGTQGLHWILANPFNNTLRFTPEEGGFALALDHDFTSLSFAEPIEMILHLGSADLLAGAKRYRRHLLDRGAWRPLAVKIAAAPQGAKLIGASHLYLWGNGLIGAKDIADWPAFLASLRTGTGLAAILLARFDPDLRDQLPLIAGIPPLHLRQAIVDAFNAALHDLARAQWQKPVVAPAEIVSAYPALRSQVIAEFGAFLAGDPSRWGSGLSAATFDTLRAAGLDRLWIGLGDGWEGALWRPEAVRDAIRNGYLIAPYDSYETAIPPGERPDWATAQLGRAAYDDCAIIGADGKPVPGFERTGHYTNPACVRPILKARIAAIARATGFNSWFLDTYATGMVNEDHRSGRTLTSAASATAQVAACTWVSETLHLPTGAEGGNSVGAQGVFFAHGVGTPLFGWGDPDMRRNRASPFFLGIWYPPESPGVFFKPVPIKQPWLSLFFDPATRLPLYQAAYHGSVITTHQWGFDQLKIANAVEDRALVDQLYNTPPLFHISADTLPERLETIRRHDAFFRPLHQRLATRTLESFEWLSEDRLLQRTRFSDGTELVANFAPGERQHGGIRLPAKSVTALRHGKAERVFETGREISSIRALAS